MQDSKPKPQSVTPQPAIPAKSKPAETWESLARLHRSCLQVVSHTSSAVSSTAQTSQQIGEPGTSVPCSISTISPSFMIENT